MERCKCGGSGYIMKPGKDPELCICKILKIYNTYLYPFRSGNPPTSEIKALVLKAMTMHKSKEQHYARKLGENTGRNDILPVTLPKHWFFIDGKKGYRLPDGRNIGKPADFYMPFFFEYLVRTKEYISYKIFDQVTLQNIYYEYGDGENVASADLEGGGTGFYGYANKTFILKFTNILPGKESFNILRHFIDTYKDRNIFIYAEQSFREKPKIRKWTGKSYEDVMLASEKSLYEILTGEYGGSFVDLGTYLIGK